MFCYKFLDLKKIYTYRPIYRNIGFLNHEILLSVSALKILYRSGSNTVCHFLVCFCVCNQCACFFVNVNQCV